MNALLKTTSIILLFTAASISLKAQEGINLVPNPSFEEYLDCPQFYGIIDDACEDWTSFKGTVDYMHSCNPVIALDLAGGKHPHTGDAYAGLITYGLTTPDFGREHIGIQLISPLVTGEKYYVSFYTSVGYTPLTHNIATNNIGVLFTTYQYYDLWLEMPNINFSHINETTIISDWENWTKVSGSFIADSAYSYMVIGNFYDDQYTETQNLPFTVLPQRAYYCIDDVCVSTDSLYTSTWLGVDNDNYKYKKKDITIYPNPVGYFGGYMPLFSVQRVPLCKILQ